MNIIDPSLPIGPKSHEQKILDDSESELAQKILSQIKQFQNCRLSDDHNLAERSKMKQNFPEGSKKKEEKAKKLSRTKLSRKKQIGSKFALIICIL